MHPADTLSQEHRIIEERLDGLEQDVAALRAGAPFKREAFDQALDFFRNFADGCHHAKEEKLLFPRMQERGVAGAGGPIAVMLREHDEGRAYLGAVRENLAAAAQGLAPARAAVIANSTSYIELLRQHIYKEDNILFRMAHVVLGPDDVADLQREFAAIEIPERFQALA
jgi:hemerythrin-like domain-containing protein